MINWIKRKLAERKYRKELKKKLEKLKSADPFIYD